MKIMKKKPQSKQTKKRIYLDYAAATPTDKRVLNFTLPFFTQYFGNSSSLHYAGREAHNFLEKTRYSFTQFLNCSPEEIIFTSSATESNNLAIKGIAHFYQDKGNKILISGIEHNSVLEAALSLKEEGFEVQFIKVNKNGEVDLKDLENKIDKKTILVSVIYASNEIGTIEPIEKIGKICRDKQVIFHTDAAQAFSKRKIDVKREKIDLLTASAQKIYGLKGAALLYIRKGIKIKPLFHGGGQEFNLRPSTVNLPAIMGFSKAAELAYKEMPEENKKIEAYFQLANNFIENEIAGIHLTGDYKNRIKNIFSFWVEGIEGESLMMALDQDGIAVSTGSACASSDLKPSHVLLSCGYDYNQAHSSLRVSFGRFTTLAEVKYFLKSLKKNVEQLRKYSPFINDSK